MNAEAIWLQPAVLNVDVFPYLGGNQLQIENEHKLRHTLQNLIRTLTEYFI